MVMVSHLYKFIFLKTRKTAGTSVEMFLEPFCAPPGHSVQEQSGALISEFGVVGQRLRPARTAQGRETIWRNHAEARDIKQALGRETWRKYVKLTSVRNPFDRMVSAFHWMGRKQAALDRQSFDLTRAQFRDFVLSGDMPDDLPIVHIGSRFVIDDTVRYETLQSDLQRLGGKLGFDPAATCLPLTKETSSLRQGRGYWDYYDTATTQAVQRQMAWVFDHYDYPPVPEPPLAAPIPPRTATALSPEF
jgi:hypothetical protein